MNLRVEVATEADVEAWLGLAAEVGELFGADMAGDPKFRRGLQRNVLERTAFCVRVDGALAGAMLFSAGAIKWLAVSRNFRRRGVGRALVAHAQSSSPTVRVTTFSAEHPHPDALAALELYRALGFAPDAAKAAPGPDGTPRQALSWAEDV